MDLLEETECGDKGFGSTGIKTTSESVQSEAKVNTNETVQNASRLNIILMNEPSQHLKKRYHTASARKILAAHQMQKLIKK